MTSNPGNPFGIPGMPPAGGGNPVMQSLEMMQQVWGNLGALSKAAPASPTLGLDELDRRITDLRAIENWLNLNLTMLRGSIQGLEVQRATIATLRAFAQSANAGAAPADAPAGEAAPSPLEAVLGLRPAAAPRAEAEPAPAAPPEPAPSASGPAAESAGAGAQAWWSLLQEQFNRIASATAASMPQPGPAAGKTDPAAPAAKPAARKSPAKKRAAPAHTPRKPKGSP